MLINLYNIYYNRIIYSVILTYFLCEILLKVLKLNLLLNQSSAPSLALGGGWMESLQSSQLQPLSLRRAQQWLQMVQSQQQQTLRRPAHHNKQQANLCLVQVGVLLLPKELRRFVAYSLIWKSCEIVASVLLIFIVLIESSLRSDLPEFFVWHHDA